MAKKIILQQDVIDSIISMYNNDKYSTAVIASKVGYSTGFIQGVLKANGIKSRSLSSACNRIKDMNNIFENINTEQSAYYLGLFFADGSIKKNSNCCELKLIEQDRPILSKLSDLIYGIDRTIFINYKAYSYAGNANNLYTLKISSPEIKSSLISNGCVSSKSLVLQFPKLQDNLIRPFIRGYFDGDGCITIDTSKAYKDFKITITSTNDFCQSLKVIVNAKLNIECNINDVSSNGITTNLRFGGNRQVLRFMSWLYEDANYYLERKHNKYLELQAWTKLVDTKTTRYQKVVSNTINHV